MIRRKGGGARRPISSALDELIAQLEAGSGGAGGRLAALVRESDSSAPLDRLAASAAAGSPYSLELLLALVVELDLAGPAIGRLIKGRSQIEDVQQEVLVAVARSIHRYRGDSRFTTWLYALARNLSIGHLRQHRPMAPLAADDLLDQDAPRRLSSLVTQRTAVRDAIDSLPPPFRQTLVLRDIEGLSYAEIAARQGLALNTVRSRLSRGRAMLAGRLS